jgi:group I intron endonuclease
MDNECFIYLTTNLVNGKKYIGSRDQTLSKNYGLYLGSGVNLKLAIKKYGRENFKRQILEECSKEERYNLESFYIKKYNVIEDPNFYNLADVRGTFSGYTHSEETKAKINTKERNKKISKARSKTVLQYDKQSHFIKEWESA